MDRKLRLKSENPCRTLNLTNLEVFQSANRALQLMSSLGCKYITTIYDTIATHKLTINCDIIILNYKFKSPGVE